MYMVQDGFTLYAFIYFVIIVAFGVFISINMFLAVISKAYEDEVEQNDEEASKDDDADAMLKLLTLEVHKALTRDISTRCLTASIPVENPYCSCKLTRPAGTSTSDNLESRTSIRENDIVRLKPLDKSNPAIVESHAMAEQGRGNLATDPNNFNRQGKVIMIVRTDDPEVSCGVQLQPIWLIPTAAAS